MKVFSEQRSPSSTQPFVVDELVTVAANDRIELRFRSDSPVDWSALGLDDPVRITYVSAQDADGNVLSVTDEAGQPLVELAAPFDMDIYFGRLPVAPVEPLVVPNDGTLRVTARLQAGGFASDHPVVFTAKREPKTRLDKHVFAADPSSDESHVVDVHVSAGDILYFDFSTLETNILAIGGLTATVTVKYKDEPGHPVPAPSMLRFATPADRCSRPYRGWSYGALHGGKVPPTTPIPYGDFCAEEFQHFDKDTQPAEDVDSVRQQAADLEQDTLTYILVPSPAGRPCQPLGAACDLPQEPVWGAADEQVYVSSHEQRASRFGPDDLTVPTAQDVAYVHGVARLSQSEQTTVGAGAGAFGISGTISHSDGSGEGVVDYLDLNGDGFPDVVGESGIQYTSARGTLEGAPKNAADAVRTSDTDAMNFGIGGNPAELLANAKGRGGTTGTSSGKTARSGSQMVSIGLSLSQNWGGNRTGFDLMDLNGDGLPDRVRKIGASIFVGLNLGYGFAPEELFAIVGAIHSGNSEETSAGANLGMNDGDYGFAGGVSGNRSSCRITDHDAPLEIQQEGGTLVDLNGDGLLDRVTPAGNSPGGQLDVQFNSGNGFGTEKASWLGSAGGRDISESASLSIGGGLYITIGVGPLCVAGCYVIINPGGDYAASTDRQEAMIRDVDGDGYPDHLYSDNGSTLEVGRNRTGRTNLLRSVTRPMGATVELDYARSGNTVPHPQSRWVMSRVVAFDGAAGDWRPANPGADFTLTTVEYSDGYYDRFEREFYGYSTVTAIEHDTRGVTGGVPAGFDQPYRRTLRTFRNDTFFTQGLLVSEVSDGFDPVGGAPLRYAELQNQYVLREVDSGHELTDPLAIKHTLSSVFPELVREIRRVSEGDASDGIQTEVQQSYDALGNVTRVVDIGDVGSFDDFVATITYTGSGGVHAGCSANHIVGLADSIVVENAAGQVLRRREASFDCSTGDLLELRQQIEASSAAVSSFVYDPRGNLSLATGPQNLNGERYALAFVYDTPTQTHVTQIADSFGYVSSASYDLRFGLLGTETDPNGNSIARSYDPYGRLATVVGPYQTGTGLATIAFEYHPEATVPFALSRHIDVYCNPADPIDTILFADGLGRVLQQKKDATVHQGPNTPAADVMVVSGRVAFDHAGRPFEVFYPVTEPANAPAVNFAFNPTYDHPVGPTLTSYDTLGRPIRTELPDGTVTARSYSIGSDKQGLKRLALTTTDAEGREVVTYRDVRELIRAVKQIESTEGKTIWTEYEHGPLEQLRAVRDDHGNVTSASYDLLGRLRVLDSPDAGRTETLYDRASNLIRKVTANLAAESKAIEYDYDFNRLKAIRYPNYAENDVDYTYGGPGLLGAPGNRVGRVTEVSDESGVEERAYGKLGELVRQTKTVASDTQGQSDSSPEIWTTSYLYDTWGRLQQMTYPDGEVLTYEYDSGGLVRTVTGQKLGSVYPYVQRLEHDKFAQRAYVLAGNGVETSFRYDPQNRRLAELTAGDFQDLAYGRDLVGNITSLENRVPVVPPKDYGGPVDQTFRYDDLNRLTRATGEWRYSPNKTDAYELDLSYDTIHNILAKTQRHDVATPGGATVPQKKTSYDFAYAYGGPRPHAATQIGDRAFFYDANGNQRGWDDLTNGQRRTIDWDEENRIQEIHDNGRTTDFKYNDAGQRVIKRGEQGETAYVNQFWTIRNRTVATKHVFVGSSRIASKLVPGDAHVDPGLDPYYQVLGQWWQHRSDQGWQSGQNVNQNPHYAGAAMPDLLPEDNFAYFYHPDHLGSSEWVTDRGGELYEHVQYFPFGEVWVSERSNTERLPYLFTSKELDDETGLYYFGARYYDPRTSVWQSTDPALPEMMDPGRSHRFVTAELGSMQLVENSAAGAQPLRRGTANSRGDVPFGVGDYDPSTGSWTGESPLLFASGQANLYGYAGSCPLNRVDPSGAFPWVPILGGAAVVLYYGATVPSHDDPAMLQEGLLAGPATLGAKFAGKAVVRVARPVFQKISGRLITHGGKAAKGATSLTKRQLKSIASLEKQITQHQQKLAQFKANPTPRPGTEHLSKEIQKKTIEGRIRHLEKEIQTFRGTIEKIRRGDL